MARGKAYGGGRQGLSASFKWAAGLMGAGALLMVLFPRSSSSSSSPSIRSFAAAPPAPNAAAPAVDAVPAAPLLFPADAMLQDVTGALVNANEVRE